MKKKFILTALSIAVLLCAVVFSGCTTETDPLEGYPIQVTYYFNGGTMADRQGVEELVVNYAENSKIIKPSAEVKLVNEVSLVGSVLKGWYYAETDSDGNLVLDENGKPTASDRQFDFDNDVVTENITLVCVWSKQVKLILNNLYRYNKVLDYTLDTNVFETPTSITIYDSSDTMTIEGYYLDAEFTQKLNDGDEIAITDSTTVSNGYYVVNIYVKLIEK